MTSPLRTVTKPGGESPGSPANRTNTPTNILIVDDEPRNLTVLETLLDSPAYRLVRAATADEALLALVNDDYALLILDIRMPGMTGFELAQTIKSRKKTASIPIIFLTAYYSEDQHIVEGYDSGAVDFLHKPVNAAVLRSKVAVFAELHRKSRELVDANKALEQSNTALADEVQERRIAEVQLRELNAVLDQSVADRTRALSASDARLRIATDAVGLGIWSWQPANDVWIWENEWFGSVHPGGTAQAPPSSALLASDFVHADDRASFLQALDAAARTGELHFEACLQAPDGKRYFVEFVGKRSTEVGGEEQLVGTARDISERRQADDTLRERERFLSTVTATARIGLAVVEPGDVYRYGNAAYSQMLDLGPGNLAGRSVQEVLGEGWAQAQARLTRAFAGERVSYEFSPPPRASSQPSRHFGVFHEPHLDPQGVLTVAVVVVEITELKQLERELRDTDRRKDEFLATLAHELRNPLAPIRNAVHILQLLDRPAHELTWARDVIERQVKVMARLIDDLMDVSRINQGRIELRREPVALSKVLEVAVESSRPQIDELGHRFVVDLPVHPVVLNADLTRLSQVFMNLLTNAAKYTDIGGLIEMRARLEGGEVKVRVKDSGIGMPADTLRKLFVMFAQAEDAVARSRGGLGIGLSLSKRLIEMHGGCVEASSAGPGQGSEFVVTLPTLSAAQGDPPRAQDPQSALTFPDQADHRILRILVVDDNRDGADTMADLLSLMGHVVQTVYDGEAAVLAVAEFKPTVMLLDIGLPKLSGYEVCRCIRLMPEGQTMTLVAMTGWGDTEAQRRVIDAGFDAHLVKPVDQTLLLSILGGLTLPDRTDADTDPPAGVAAKALWS